MQPRGRRRYRSKRLRIHSLVLFTVTRRVRAIDIRRQRDMPNALQDGEEIVYRIEAQVTLSEIAAYNNFSREFMGLLVGFESEIQALAYPQLASGMDQCL